MLSRRSGLIGAYLSASEKELIELMAEVGDLLGAEENEPQLYSLLAHSARALSSLRAAGELALAITSDSPEQPPACEAPDSADHPPEALAPDASQVRAADGAAMEETA